MSIDLHFVPPEDIVPLDSKIIIDLGCNDGYTTEFFAERFKDARIIGVELVNEVAIEAANRVSKYGNRVSILNEAIGWPEGKFTAWVDECSTVSSITPYQDRSTYPISVDVISLNNLLEREGIEEVDFMKIDIEGAETMLLQSTEWMSKVKCFIVECHNEQVIEDFYNIDEFKVKPLFEDPKFANHLIAVTK